ncbi:hypothetical protein LCGC14_3010220, partial [marine sediment metagenome]
IELPDNNYSLKETHMSSMFCYQCEQTAQGSGCTSFGVCGKDPESATLQDLLVHAAKGISQYAHRARQFGASDREVDVFVVEALFTTVTNVNFDPARLQQLLLRAAMVRDKARKMYEEAAGDKAEELTGAATWVPEAGMQQLVTQGEEVTIANRLELQGPDVTGLQELILYGLKGSAAYADHAQVLGKEDDAVYAFFHETLDYLAGDPTDVDDLVAHVLKCGEVNIRVMQLLDEANTGSYGHPEPTQVRVTPIKGK